MKNVKNKGVVQSEAVTHNPFAVLGAKLSGVPSMPTHQSAELSVCREEKKNAPAKATVRMERKGRGGKEATIVEGLSLSDNELATWLVELKKVMGCGGTVEGGTLLVQGDQRSRVAEWLKKVKGVGKVSVG